VARRQQPSNRRYLASRRIGSTATPNRLCGKMRATTYVSDPARPVPFTPRLSACARRRRPGAPRLMPPTQRFQSAAVPTCCEYRRPHAPPPPDVHHHRSALVIFSAATFRAGISDWVVESRSTSTRTKTPAQRSPESAGHADGRRPSRSSAAAMRRTTAKTPGPRARQGRGLTSSACPTSTTSS